MIGSNFPEWIEVLLIPLLSWTDAGGNGDDRRQVIEISAHARKLNSKINWHLQTYDENEHHNFLLYPSLWQMSFILLASNILRLLSNKDARSRCWWLRKKESFWVSTFCRRRRRHRSTLCTGTKAFCFRSRTLIIFHFIYQHITTLRQLSISQAVLSRLQKYKNKIYW